MKLRNNSFAVSTIILSLLAAGLIAGCNSAQPESGAAKKHKVAFVTNNASELTAVFMRVQPSIAAAIAMKPGAASGNPEGSKRLAGG